MKFRKLMCFTAATLSAALAIPVSLAAQDNRDNNNRKHYRYQLNDLGTFGGPSSYVPIVFYEINGTAGARAISNHGTVAGFADTSTVDPLCYFENDCYYPNAFQWQDGVLTNLGGLPGSLDSYGYVNWISGNGLITGFSENGQTDPLNGFPEIRAVLWQDGQVTDLSTLQGGYESWAWAVNNRGQVVGSSANGTLDPYSYFYFQIFGSSTGTQTRAFLWDERNGMQDLGTLGGPDAWAGLVNERGQVAGISYTSFTPNANNANCAPNTPTQDPFFWEKDTGMIDMGTFGGTCGITNALNNQGRVAGQSYLPGNLTAHAFLWTKPGPMQDLGTLGGDNASALWLNDAGDVVGYADLPPNPPGCSGLTCQHHAALWKQGVTTDLGTIGTDPCSRATSINSRDQIVGFTAAVCGGQATHGFLWEKGGPAIDLNTLAPPGSGLTLAEPVYINDRGEIAGFAVLSNGDTHAFLLTPCREGCEEGSLTGAVQSVPAQVSQTPATAMTAASLPGERMGAIRSRFGRHYPNRDFGTYQPK
jgi:probable HAF family extracellular repeat protein